MLQAIGKLGVGVIFVGGFFYMLWQQQAADKAIRDQAQQKQIAELKAREAAAAQLIANPEAAKAEIYKRLDSWISARDDYLILQIVRSSGSVATRTMPRSRSWTVTCTAGRLAAEFSTLNDDEDDIAMRVVLLPGKLTAEQCKQFVEVAATRMAALVRQ